MTFGRKDNAWDIWVHPEHPEASGFDYFLENLPSEEPPAPFETESSTDEWRHEVRVRRARAGGATP